MIHPKLQLTAPVINPHIW